jgi:START domain
MAKVVGTVQDFAGRLSWDQNIKGLDKIIIKTLSGEGATGDEICAFRSATKAVGPISGRDFVDAIYVGKFSSLPEDVKKCLAAGQVGHPDECLINGGMGAEAGHPSFPETKEFVRGLNYPGSGWLFEPTGPESVRIYYCVQSQLNGWLPAAVVNSSMQGMFVDFFKCLIKRLDETS